VGRDAVANEGGQVVRARILLWRSSGAQVSELLPGASDGAGVGVRAWPSVSMAVSVGIRCDRYDSVRYGSVVCGTVRRVRYGTNDPTRAQYHYPIRFSQFCQSSGHLPGCVHGRVAGDPRVRAWWPGGGGGGLLLIR
jgi:hypothetical protein